MSKPQIPFSFLYGNKCLSCNRPIEGGKVYLLSDGRIMCDQCRVFTKQFCRNLIYEALASNFLYPCINWQKHCPAMLEWKDAPYHISSCRYSGCCGLLFSHPGSCFKGKRSFPYDDDQKGLIAVPDRVESFLRCAGCKGYLNCEPIYTQSDKESFCHRCVAVNGKPPDAVRNFPYENISTLFLFPCSFKRFGCMEVLPFGKPAWKHEYECHYNAYSPLNKIEEVEAQSTPRSSVQISECRPSLTRESETANSVVEEEPRPSKGKIEKTKKKGLIWTQTGPLWATLSPNTPLMAPPQRPGEESNQDIINQIKKKQGKHRQPIQDYDGDMGRRNSESESVSTNSQNAANVDPIETASKASSFDYMEENKAYDNPAYDQDIMRQRNGVARTPSIQASRYDVEMASHFPGLYNQNQYNYRASEEEMAGHFPYLSRSSTRYNEAVVAGHFPIMLPRQLNETVDTLGRRVSKRENFQGNRLLISELKMRQDMIKRNHSIRDQPREVPRQQSGTAYS
ncbi:uncharacterized protein LOC143206586 [Rhynchophorus ferrugineus]